MVMACADGQANDVVAEQFGVTPKTIGKWRARFTQRRLDGLADEPRPGAPRKVTDVVSGRVLAKTLHERPTNASRWTTRSMARATGLSQTAIVRIWMAHGLRPRKSQGHRPATELVGQIVRLRQTRQREISHPDE